MTTLGINQLAVLGSGTMGCGLAVSLAQIDVPVILWTRSSERKIKRKIDDLFYHELQQPHLTTEEKKHLLSNIYITSELPLVVESQIIIEAVVEEKAVKKRLISTLGELCSPSTILASTTATVSIDDLAAGISHPERVIGMRFFNPPYLVPLVEIVCGNLTSKEAFLMIKELALFMGKDIIRVSNKPGVMVNRLLLGLLVGAIVLLDQEKVSPEELDKAISLVSHMPLGPLALADQMGLDTLLYSLKSLYQALPEERYNPPPLLERMVKEGRLGKKTGEGFYKYSS